MTNNSTLTSVYRWLIFAAVLLVAQFATAQQPLSQADIEAQLQQRSTIERELGQLGQRPQTALLSPIDSPSELQTNLPPMTESTTDAAELLGTDYFPGNDAMFGKQLFQPGIHGFFYPFYLLSYNELL